MLQNKMKENFIAHSLFLYIEREIAAKLNTKSVIYGS
jgi:hypothetical protein